MGHIAVGVGCMDARPASGACGAQSQAMCALQQGWVLWARRGDAPQRQLEEVAAGRCITGEMSTLIWKTSELESTSLRKRRVALRIGVASE